MEKRLTKITQETQPGALRPWRGKHAVSAAEIIANKRDKRRFANRPVI